MTTPTLTTRLLIAVLRTYFRSLARLAPVTAGRHAYTLFGTPRKRGRIPPAVEPVMARAERLDLDVEGERVAAYRRPVWGQAGERPCSGFASTSCTFERNRSRKPASQYPR